MTRDWYTLGQLAFFPMLATMLLHGLVLAMLILRWQGDAQSRTIEASVLPPAAINATLIDASSLKAKKEPAKRAPPPKRAAPVKPNPKPVAKTPIVPSKPVVKADPKPAEKLPEARRLSADELAAISRSEMADALAAEDAMTVAVTAEEMAASYAALIRDTVSGYWRRPPSARNGMEVLLSVQLVPTGEVVAVNVLRSSGNEAFDRSAISAVERASSFPELRNLPNKEFEDTFRRFQLLFRPEDLRY